MRKNELISISTLSPGGRQSYVKPTINVLGYRQHRILGVMREKTNKIDNTVKTKIR